MLRITEVKMPLDHKPEDLRRQVCRILKTDEIRCMRMVKKSIDARDKDNIRFVYSLDIEVADEKKYIQQKNVSIAKHSHYEPQASLAKLPYRPVVAGSGPAGLFAALVLAEAGCQPIVLERGKDVEARKKDVEAFWRTGVLDPESNVQFGEGGAGTFSDGKLTTGVNDPRSGKVLAVFIDAGAPEEIRYLSKPHIGTDKLTGVIRNIRQKVISLGGTFCFETKLTGIHQHRSRLEGIICESPGGMYEIDTPCLVLAVGHSARDTFQALFDDGVAMMGKAFAVGVRIEHRQKDINESLYGRFAQHPALGPADYKLSAHLKNGRGVYTFCMCPGGSVVAAASEGKRVATNGMSYHARDMANANAALLVSVTPQDFGSNDPLAGVAFQRRLEAHAYEAGGGRYIAPAQMVGDFLQRRATRSFGTVEPSYRPGVHATDLRHCLDGFLIDALQEGIRLLDKKKRGFAAYEAVMTAVESRSSSPVRIPRDHNGQSNIAGIIPCGEGAGYAGGIMSAAIDGIRCAEYVLAH